MVSGWRPAASGALRRKSYGKSSLAVLFIGQVIFVLYLLVFYMGWLTGNKMEHITGNGDKK